MVTRCNLKLNQRACEAIINQTKNVEIRPNKFSYISQNNKMIKCEVIDIILYQNLREPLTTENINKTLSSRSNINDGIASVESISNYKELMDKFGVYAVRLNYIIH
jgi:ASC-1-like (ASCH) protein